MGGPAKRNNYNVADTYGQSLEYSFRDYGTGLGQIAQGNVAQGLQNFGVGALGISTGGTSQALGITGSANARDQATADNNAAVQAAEADAKQAEQISAQQKTDKIQARLNAEIKLRKKAPGVSRQTLLTSNLVPENNSSGSILTGGR